MRLDRIAVIGEEYYQTVYGVSSSGSVVNYSLFFEIRRRSGCFANQTTVEGLQYTESFAVDAQHCHLPLSNVGQNAPKRDPREKDRGNGGSTAGGEGKVCMYSVPVILGHCTSPRPIET